METKKKSYRKWLNSKKLEYKRNTALAKREVRKRQRPSWDKFVTNLEHDTYRTQPKVHKFYYYYYYYYYYFLWCCGPTWAMASSFVRFLDHTQRCITVGRTPLYEWSARRRDLYLTTHNTRNRQTSMPPVGFEPTISAGKRSQTYALDRTATGTGDGVY